MNENTKLAEIRDQLDKVVFNLLQTALETSLSFRDGNYIYTVKIKQ